MTPEQVASIVDDRLKQLFAPAQSRFISDEEVRGLLRCSSSKLRDLIAKGELVQGAHFTGKGKDRLWMRDRVERYIETRDNPAAQAKDIKSWLRG